MLVYSKNHNFFQNPYTLLATNSNQIEDISDHKATHSLIINQLLIN